MVTSPSSLTVVCTWERRPAFCARDCAVSVTLPLAFRTLVVLVVRSNASSPFMSACVVTTSPSSLTVVTVNVRFDPSPLFTSTVCTRLPFRFSAVVSVTKVSFTRSPFASAELVETNPFALVTVTVRATTVPPGEKLVAVTVTDPSAASTELTTRSVAPSPLASVVTVTVRRSALSTRTVRPVSVVPSPAYSDTVRVTLPSPFSTRASTVRASSVPFPSTSTVLLTVSPLALVTVTSRERRPPSWFTTCTVRVATPPETVVMSDTELSVSPSPSASAVEFVTNPSALVTATVTALTEPSGFRAQTVSVRAWVVPFTVTCRTRSVAWNTPSWF